MAWSALHKTHITFGGGSLCLSMQGGLSFLLTTFGFGLGDGLCESWNVTFLLEMFYEMLMSLYNVSWLCNAFTFLKKF